MRNRGVSLKLAPWGPGILMSLLVLGLVTGGAINPLGTLIRTLSDLVFKIIL